MGKSFDRIFKASLIGFGIAIVIAVAAIVFDIETNTPIQYSTVAFEASVSWVMTTILGSVTELMN